MSLVFIDSFDHYVTADITKKWTTYSNVTISASNGRRGTAGLAVPASSSYLTKNVPSAATYTVGFSFKYVAAASSEQYTMFGFKEGTVWHLSVILHSNGTFEVKRGDYGGTSLGTSVVGLSLGATNYIEFKATINDTTGAFELRLNGTNILSASGVDTRNAGVSGVVSTLQFCNPVGSGCWTGYIDDFYLADANGSANNTFLGDIRVDCVFPNADGTYLDATPSTGTTHYVLVDETAPTTTDYNSLGATNQKDTYGFASIPSAGTSNIKGVQINSALLKSDSGSRGASNTVLSAGTLAYSSSSALGTSLSYVMSVHENDPATAAAWTESAVNAAEFGVRADA